MFDRCQANQTENKLKLVHNKYSLPTHLHLNAHFILVQQVHMSGLKGYICFVEKNGLLSIIFFKFSYRTKYVHMYM